MPCPYMVISPLLVGRSQNTQPAAQVGTAERPLPGLLGDSGAAAHREASPPATGFANSPDTVSRSPRPRSPAPAAGTRWRRLLFLVGFAFLRGRSHTTDDPGHDDDRQDIGGHLEKLRGNWSVDEGKHGLENLHLDLQRIGEAEE
jgi:hypothetical protein